MAEGMHSLAGKRIVVSGGTSGIGRAIVAQLALVNARILFFARSEEDVRHAQDDFQGTLGLRADVSSREDCVRIYQRAEQELGGLDALINNAGIAGMSVIDDPEDEWRTLIDVDLVGPMRMTALAFPLLQKAGGGHIVNIGSMSAKRREAESNVYIAAKMGLRGFSDAVGKQLAEHNINVTLLEPGLVQSDMSTGGSEEDQKRIAEATMLEEEDIARSVLFVLSQPPRCTIPMMQVRPRMQLI